MFKLKPSCQLTERESEILSLLTEGWSNKQIALKLQITVRTVKFHTNNLYAKIEVASRAEAIAWVLKQYTPKLYQISEDSCT
jgi:DNA-binding NarL/FixJ family response regulator